jgi:hypothetical protein
MKRSGGSGGTKAKPHNSRKIILKMTMFELFTCKMYLKCMGYIDAHGLKIQGRWYLMFFAKIPRGVKAFRKNCLGGPPISGFIAFLLASVLKFA